MNILQATCNLTLLGLTLAVTACSSAPTVQEIDGWSQLERHDYQKALTAFDVALRQNETAELQAGRGRALYFLDQHIASESAYGRALELNPGQPQWHMELALVHIACQDFNDAIAACNEAIRLDPYLAKAYHNRGFVRHVQHHLSAAAADFTKAIQLNSEFAEAYNSRGILQAERGDYRSAIADFQAAVRLMPHLASAHANAAAANYALGNAELAFVGLNSAIKIDRKNPLFYKNRGRIYLDLGNLDAAINDFEEALVYAPGDPKLWELLTAARRAQSGEATS